MRVDKSLAPLCDATRTNMFCHISLSTYHVNCQCMQARRNIQGHGDLSLQCFDRYINPIPIKGGRLSPPIRFVPGIFSELPVTLYNRIIFQVWGRP